MSEVREVDRSSSALARWALLIASGLAVAGSALGVVGMRQGLVAGLEAILILSSLLVSLGALATLLFCPKIGVQRVATVVTGFFAVYLCACSIVALSDTGHHPNLFIY